MMANSIWIIQKNHLNLYANYGDLSVYTIILYCGHFTQNQSVYSVFVFQKCVCTENAAITSVSMERAFLPLLARLLLLQY